MRLGRSVFAAILVCSVAASALLGAMPASAQTQNAGNDWFGKWILPHYRIVSYYGNPLSPYMGILGEYPPKVMLQKLAAQAAQYQAIDPSHPVLKALEMVATVAQGSPGPDGAYSVRMPLSLIWQELRLARSAHAILILDVQVGHATVASQVEYLAPLLRQPDVELALDPEFDMPPGGVPGKVFGSMRTSDINWTIQYLNRMVIQDHLPQKVLILHQFIESMVPHWQGIVEAPYVALVRNQDGFGGWPVKSANYERFIRQEAVPYIEPPAFSPPQLGTALPINEGTLAMYAEHSVVLGGMKLFYTQDKPVMSPETVLRTLDPAPLVVIYQ